MAPSSSMAARPSAGCQLMSDSRVSPSFLEATCLRSATSHTVHAWSSPPAARSLPAWGRVVCGQAVCTCQRWGPAMLALLKPGSTMLAGLGEGFIMAGSATLADLAYRMTAQRSHHLKGTRGRQAALMRLVHPGHCMSVEHSRGL